MTSPLESITQALKDGGQLPSGPVSFIAPPLIPDGAVTTPKIADGAVTPAKLDPSVTFGDMKKSDYDTDNDGVVDQAKKLQTPRSIALSGDVTGSVNFDGSANVTIMADVADNSHGHTVTNVTGLQTALDAKAALSHTHPISEVTDLQSTLDAKASLSTATTAVNGLLSATDKTKLDGIQAGATNYVHPANHPATMITEDTTHLFMTTAERDKLTGIAAGATNYVHPANHPATMITEDSTHLFMTTTERDKLSGIATGAEVNQNTFMTVAVSGQANVVADTKTDTLTLVGGTGITITTDATTDAVTFTATGAATPGAHATSHVTGGADVIPNAVAAGNSGLMSGTDKTKLDGIAAGAEVNQNTFSKIAVAGQVDVDADTKSDTLTLAAGTGIAITTTPATDLITITATGAPGVHATTHVTGGTDVIPNAVSGGNSGLMSGTDKTKLDGIAAGATNYVHPATHPATMITEDTTHRFVTDAEKATWNAGGSIADGAVTTAKLADLAVTEAKLADNTVSAIKIQNFVITANKLGTDSVTDVKIGNRTITDTVVADAVASSPTDLWSKLGYMIKAITGKANWYTPPVTTIEALSTGKLDSSTYTAADVLAKLLTVDGSASGLDSATVGGKTVTTSAAAPSGGVDGDIWIQY